MSFWDHVYASRVPMWLVQLVTYVVGLAILEANTEGANITSFVLAVISALFQLWYTAYVAWRLWSFLGNKTRPKPNARDYHSIWVWFDIFFALGLVWTYLSQSIYVLWPHTFEVDHLPSNHWHAAIHWIWNSVDTMVTNGTPFEPLHAGTRFLYAFIGIVQYFYIPVVVAIGLTRSWEHKEVKEHDLEQGHISQTQQSRDQLSSSSSGPFQRSTIASFASMPPPSVYPTGSSVSSAVVSGDFASWYASTAARKPMALASSSAASFHDVYAWPSN